MTPHIEPSNVYFIGDRETAIIDAGYPTEESAEAILSGWNKLGKPEIKAVLLTHAHIDHAGAIEAIRHNTGAPVYLHNLENERLKNLFPIEQYDIIFKDSGHITIGSLDIEFLYMPGHTSGHICFYEKSEGALFSGDMIVGNEYAAIVPPDGDMSAYMRSLERAKELTPKIILPGHGDPLREPMKKIEEYILHRNLRQLQILMLLENNTRSIPDMSEEIYAGLLPGLRLAGRLQIMAHLEKMEREGFVEHVSGEGTDGVYRSLVGKVEI